MLSCEFGSALDVFMSVKSLVLRGLIRCKPEMCKIAFFGCILRTGRTKTHLISKKFLNFRPRVVQCYYREYASIEAHLLGNAILKDLVEEANLFSIHQS